MYENGVKCVGYNRKRLHRRKLKKQLASIHGYTSVGVMFVDSARDLAKYEQRWGTPFPFGNWADRYWKCYSGYPGYERILHRAEIRKRRHQEQNDIRKMTDL